MVSFITEDKLGILVARNNIANRVIEDQAQEIAQLSNEIHSLKRELAAEKSKNKPKSSEVKLYRFPNLTPGI